MSARGVGHKLGSTCPVWAIFGSIWLRTAGKTAESRGTVVTLPNLLAFPIPRTLPPSKSACDMPLQRPKNGSKWPRNAVFLLESMQQPQTKTGLCLGLPRSKSNSEATLSTCKPPLFVVSPQNGPNRHLNTCTSARSEPAPRALRACSMAIFGRNQPKDSTQTVTPSQTPMTLPNKLALLVSRTLTSPSNSATCPCNAPKMAQTRCFGQYSCVLLDWFMVCNSGHDTHTILLASLFHNTYNAQIVPPYA